YFLSRNVPRVCTPAELVEFVKAWDWAQIRAKPYLVRVRRAEGGETNGPTAETWKVEGLKRLAKDPAGALLCFEMARRVDPGAGDALVGMGLASWRVGDILEAVRCFDEALHLDPRRVD